MNKRQENILEIIVREYQKTGQPVASGILVDKYGLELSPATIRAEMLALDEEGLLVQPHTSAGRVPTTKAYRLFVDKLLEKKELNLKDKERIKKGLQKFDEEVIFSHQIAQMLADFSHNLGVSGFIGEQFDFHEAGFSSLFQDIELCQPESLADILRGFDLFEEKIDEIFNQLQEETEVFIGEENPINDFKKCSLVISNYEKRGKKGFIGILGPKRMNYARNIFLVQETKKLIKNK
jgi:transcriptional regulator of heat shock response